MTDGMARIRALNKRYNDQEIGLDEWNVAIEKLLNEIESSPGGTSVAAPDPTTRLTNFFNALENIKAIATLHYIGGAFEPEHMRTLANIAVDALNGRDIPPVPDAEEVRALGRKLADEYAQWVD